MENDVKIDAEVDTDVLIIGGGGSGLAGAVAAAEKRVKALVVEKRTKFGGNAALAGGMFASESHIQKKLGIEETKDDHFKAMMDHSHWKIYPRIVREVINRSGDTIKWIENMGLKFEIPPFYSDLLKTAHMAEGHGAGIIKTLVNRCEALNIKLLSDTTAKKILTGDNGVVRGAIVETEGKDYEIKAQAILIATGGYAGNKELLQKHYPFYSDDMNCIGLPHMGEGISMAIESGAATEGLGNLHLRGPYHRGAMECVVAGMQPNAIWVNRRGERFVDEGKTFFWPESANALNAQPDQISFTIFDNRLKKMFSEEGIIIGYNRFRKDAKLIKLEEKLISEEAGEETRVSDSWEGIAEWIGADPNVLKDTVFEYNAFCDSGKDESFLKDREYLVPLESPPYYGIKCNQGFFGTIGGIKINHRMEVLSNKGLLPIPGLYAAGNDTGGWETDTYSLLLPGMTFGFAVNSGRIAGENAVEYLNAKD